MALHSGSFQHRSWDSGFYFLFQFCVRFSVIVRFLQNTSFEIGSSPLPPPPLSEAPLRTRYRVQYPTTRSTSRVLVVVVQSYVQVINC